MIYPDLSDPADRRAWLTAFRLTTDPEPAAYVHAWRWTRDLEHLHAGRLAHSSVEIDEALRDAELVEPEMPFELDGLEWEPVRTSVIHRPNKEPARIYGWVSDVGRINRGPKPLTFEEVRAKVDKMEAKQERQRRYRREYYRVYMRDYNKGIRRRDG